VRCFILDIPRLTPHMFRFYVLDPPSSCISNNFSRLFFQQSLDSLRPSPPSGTLFTLNRLLSRLTHRAGPAAGKDHFLVTFFRSRSRRAEGGTSFDGAGPFLEYLTTPEDEISRSSAELIARRTVACYWRDCFSSRSIPNSVAWFLFTGLARVARVGCSSGYVRNPNPGLFPGMLSLSSLRTIETNFLVGVIPTDTFVLRMPIFLSRTVYIG